ncbi:extensin family protein [Alloalcanivorax sp. C16-2]|uniref:extensin-like domain-containing protein n=1 Tax=Alloalcanivorax TaxID=3020832 RepID=UPI00193194F2|nr:extensin family protein [Alloalcanivorax marinus]MBL7251909.1 extensin family protein [Alloalcanivorax marinus]
MARFLIVLLILVLAAGVFVAGLKQQWWPVPRHWNPFMALHLDDPITPVTRWKLRRLGNRPEACRVVLNSAPEGTLDVLPLKDYTPVESCPLTNVARVRSTTVGFNNSFVARCPLVAAWSLYERQRLQPLAREYFGQPVAEVWHYGSFACRNIYHRADDRRSDHATASALDVAAFSLADGTRVSVQNHWDDEGDKGAFLHAVFEGACGLFGTALGPDYNAAHGDHFHFGLRGFGICR